MSDNESIVGSPQTLHEEEKDDQPKDQELGDYDVEAAGDSDKDNSDDDLSDIDEDQFGDYDPAAARIEEKPVEIDEDVARTLKAGKRKGLATKKPKEGRREKKKRRRDEEDNDGADGEILSGKRSRKTGAVSSRKASPEPIDESTLTPEERRRRAIERAAAGEVKNKVKRRKKKDEVDLEAELDEQIAALKTAMENACRDDNNARSQHQPAIHKLKLLPEVMALLNRNNQQSAIVDPDANFLESVKFFLEPLSDGSLPAYNIQRDIFTALHRLPIEKETLLASGIGKIVLFYTKSRKAEKSVKRLAEQLLGDWSRPILRKTHDYKQRQVETRDFDYQAAKLRQAAGSSQFTLTQRPATSQQTLRDAERERILAPNVVSNRARVGGLPAAYTVAPKSTFEPSRDSSHRPIGSSGIEAFRKMTQKGKRAG
ncbi:putative Transcription factor IWS1 [Seiridium cardinale]|uniref:Transcription factor IWS1 n=1 Tax=Seiridium cardinale TaxID=138064 RepID=A0ABR2XNZ1_9PEZI